MTTVFIAAQSGAANGGGMSMLIMMVALFAIMWFFMIRPQQKKQKEIQKFQNALTEVSRWLLAVASMALSRRSTLLRVLWKSR